MTKYIYTQHGLGHINVGGTSYMLEHGDKVELPEDDAAVKDLVMYGYLKVVPVAEIKPVEIKGGDNVQLIDGGGTTMMVKKVKGENITCTWTLTEEGGKLGEPKEDTFKASLLKKV